MATGTSDRPTDPLAGREVLIVDDSRMTLELIGRRLEKLGCEAAQAIDGVDALALLDHRAFDIVLLDMVMPRHSGVRTLRDLRALPRHADTPVIMMTAQAGPGAAIEALEAGADDHIAKPFDFAVLTARMRRLLRRAAMIGTLRQTNAYLDARVSELGMLRAELAAAHFERGRLADTVARLTGEVERLRA